jgi:hypothetical protein
MRQTDLKMKNTKIAEFLSVGLFVLSLIACNNNPVFSRKSGGATTIDQGQGASGTPGGGSTTPPGGGTAGGTTPPSGGGITPPAGGGTTPPGVAVVNPPAATPLPDYVFLQDSFERDDIVIDLINNILYGWRGFVLDGANSFIGFQTGGAGASIPAAGALGPAQDGSRFLLMAGRDNGAAVENIQIITPSYDLSMYNSAIITFHYMTFGLNDADDVVPEGLKLEVCKGTLNDCGANDDAIYGPGLLSNNWVTVAVNNPAINDDAFNGKNHAASDWQTGIAVVDLNNPAFVGSSSTFVMRFSGVMKDGYTPGVTTTTTTTVCENDINDNDEDLYDSDFSGDNDDGVGRDDDRDHDDDKDHHDKNEHNDNKDNDHNDNDNRNNDKDHRSNDKDIEHSNRKISSNDDGEFKEHDSDSRKHDSDSGHQGTHKSEHHSKEFKHKKHSDKNECVAKTTTVVLPPDGTLKDGIAIDNLRATATQLFINEIF